MRRKKQVAPERLPEWFTRPSPAAAFQLLLFPHPLDDVLANLRLSPEELTSWHERGWLSFPYAREKCLQDWELAEIRFVHAAVRSGLSTRQVAKMLKHLPRPLSYDPERAAYNFRFGWVEVAPPDKPDVTAFMDQHLDEWLSGLAEQQPDRLVRLRSLIAQLLKSQSKR